MPPRDVSCNGYSIGERYTKIQTYLNRTHSEKEEQQTVHKENSVSSSVVAAGMRAWGMGTSFLAVFCRYQQAFLDYCTKKRSLLQKSYQQQSSMTVCSDPTQMAITQEVYGHG